MSDETERHAEFQRLAAGGLPQAPASAEQRDGNRTKQFVSEISTHAKLQLGEMRDQIDDVVRAISEREARLIADIEEHIKFSTVAIKAKLIIAESLADVQKCFEPMPRPTITQRNGNGHG